MKKFVRQPREDETFEQLRVEECENKGAATKERRAGRQTWNEEKKRKWMVRNLKTSLIKGLTPSSEECGENNAIQPQIHNITLK